MRALERMTRTVNFYRQFMHCYGYGRRVFGSARVVSRHLAGLH